MEGEGRRTSPLLAVTLAFMFIFYLMASAVADEILPTMTLSEKVGGEGAQAAAAGAGELAGYLRDNEGIIDGDGDLNDSFEEAEILQVLDAVAAYNEEVKREVTVSYEYLHMEGLVESFDPVTGSASVTSWKETRTGTREAGRHQEIVGVERVRVEYTQEELNAMAAELGGSSFTPPPAWFDRPIYREVIDYEQVETEITHEPVTEKRTATATLSRMAAEPNGMLLGEDVYELDWRPVLVLCYMMTKGRDGFDHEMGERSVIPKEDVDAAINFFGYQYSYVDDASAEQGFDGRLERFDERNSAYRVEVSGSPVVGSVCSFDVRRVPQVAPKLIANAYLSYEYAYEDGGEGTKVLSKRTVTIDGTSFAAGCAELCGGEFDAELFVEYLETLPGGEEISPHYRMLTEGYCVTEDTTEQGECPAVGTLVSAKSGWTVRNAERFFAGIVGYSTDGEARPSGADVVTAVSWSPSAEALSNEEFDKIWETASSCIGTKYVFGSNAGPGKGFDCSAYVSWVLRESGTARMGRLTTTSFLGSPTGVTDAGWVTQVESPMPGDLVFFKGTIKDRDKSHVSHVAIFLGDGMIIHASGSAGCVTVTSLEGSDLMRNHFMLYARVRKDK